MCQKRLILWRKIQATSHLAEVLQNYFILFLRDKYPFCNCNVLCQIWNLKVCPFHKGALFADKIILKSSNITTSSFILLGTYLFNFWDLKTIASRLGGRQQKVCWTGHTKGQGGCKERNLLFCPPWRNIMSLMLWFHLGGTSGSGVVSAFWPPSLSRGLGAGSNTAAWTN